MNRKEAIKNFSFSENVYSASFRDDGKLMCVGFETNNVKVYPLLEDQSHETEMMDESSNASTKPKKRPLRKFDDHLG